MSSPRYLTKSRFKLAADCPTKLFYSGKPQLYRNLKQEDSFLAMLADGGYQVGELAKCFYPTGVEISSPNNAVAEAQTLKWPEYISAAIQAWAQEWGIRLEYIQPGNPKQNAYVERFNRTVLYEWLSQYYWTNLAEVQDFATKWMWSYNHDRPNMALGGFTPKQRLAMAA